MLILGNQGWTLLRSERDASRFTGNPFRSDPELGYSPRPDSAGELVGVLPRPVPYRHDSLGFRVPVEDRGPRPVRRPRVLSLGCSFTYGYGVAAEQAYPYLVAARLGGSEVNAAIPGQGLAQMVLIARKWIPRLRPELVTVQYSPWLVERNLTPFYPHFNLPIPAPYFGSGSPARIEKPPYASGFDPATMDRYLSSEPSLGSFARYEALFAMPLFFRSDWSFFSYRVKRLLGAVPSSASALDAALSGYREITEIARHAGAKVVIVKFQNRLQAADIPPGILPAGSVVVDADQAELRELKNRDPGEFARLYQISDHDVHPSARAHALVAREILKALGQSH